MDLTRLRHFVTVVETGSMRRASDLIGCTPAAISKSVKMLEREVGTALTRPDGRGIRPTIDGERLAANATRLLAEYQLLRQSIGPVSGQNELGTLRIASFEVFTTYFLGELATAEFDGQPISITSSIPGAVEHAVAAKDADFGLTCAPSPVTGVEHTRVGAVPTSVYHAAGSPIGHMDLDEVPFVVPASRVEGPTVENSNADGWPDRRPRRAMYRVNAMESALELCRRGGACVFVPRFVVALHNRQVRPKFQLVEHVRATKLDFPEHDLFLVGCTGVDAPATAHRLHTAAARIIGL